MPKNGAALVTARDNRASYQPWNEAAALQRPPAGSGGGAARVLKFLLRGQQVKRGLKAQHVIERAGQKRIAVA